jgi:hypothetical protein
MIKCEREYTFSGEDIFEDNDFIKGSKYLAEKIMIKLKSILKS